MQVLCFFSSLSFLSLLRDHVRTSKALLEPSTDQVKSHQVADLSYLSCQQGCSLAALITVGREGQASIWGDKEVLTSDCSRMLPPRRALSYSSDSK